MPRYIYQHPSTGETKEIIQTMTEPHVYFEDNVEWKRVFVNPQVSLDSTINNPFSKEEFLSKTRDKKDSVGGWIDRSMELSEKRASKDGLDPVKEQYFKNYSKKRKGKQLLEVRQRKVKEKLDKMGVILE